MGVMSYCLIHYYIISRKIKRITCGLWGKTIWMVRQSWWITRDSSSSPTLRDEEILFCIQFTNLAISQKVLWKWFLFSEVVFPLDKATERPGLRCPSKSDWGSKNLGQESSAAWHSQTRCQQYEQKRQACTPLCPSWALPFYISYFTFVTWKLRN